MLGMIVEFIVKLILSFVRFAFEWLFIDTSNSNNNSKKLLLYSFVTFFILCLLYRLLS